MLVARAGPADAHPLGNFTVNHSTTIEVADSGVTVVRVLDMAEIPTFQTLQRLEKGPGGQPILEPWAQARADELRANMRIGIDGREVRLTAVSHDVALREGQGGLQTLRLVATYMAPLPDGWRDGSPKLTYADGNDTGRIGWREVIARGGPGVDLSGSALPLVSPTEGLLTYPEGTLSSPPDVREATFSFGLGVGAPLLPAPDADHVTATRGNPDGTLARFTRLISHRELDAGFIAFALLAAMAFGALHALSPGHGKTVVAAYLIGSHGTLRHALLLGITVTATHTSSVYVLGFVTLYLSQYVVPEDLYPWMGVISGGIILLMGLSLFAGRLRSSGLAPTLWRHVSTAWHRRRPVLTLAAEPPATAFDASLRGDERQDHHEHRHGGEGHAHAEHSHGGGSHSHAIPGGDGEPVTWQRLVGLGVFGGMIPCPSAIVVMLSAIALHRVGFGLVLIVAFSFGLAAVLTGIGFVLVWAQRTPLLRRFVQPTERIDGPLAIITRTLPVAAAALVFAVGVVLVMRGASQL